MKGIRRPLEIRIAELEIKRDALKDKMNRLIDRIGALNSKITRLNMKKIHQNLVKEEPTNGPELEVNPIDPNTGDVIHEGAEFQTPEPTPPTALDPEPELKP